MLKRKVVWIGMTVVILFVFGISQSQAQSSLTLESLSDRISALARRVSVLTNTKAGKNELAALENRIATLEARLGDSTPIPTSTSKRPTLTPTPHPPTTTPTRPRPTAASTPAKAYISITRDMNVRRGPDTTYDVVGYATVGQEFDTTGQNAGGTWWRIDFKGQNAWIYAPLVTAVNANNVPVVSIPALPAPTPRPTSPPSSQQNSDLGVVGEAAMLVILDRQRSDLLRNWNNLSQEERNQVVAGTVILLEFVAEYCRMSTAAVAVMIDGYAQDLDDAGYTTRNDIRARATLMYVLVNTEEATRSSSGCHNWLGLAVRRILASE